MSFERGVFKLEGAEHAGQGVSYLVKRQGIRYKIIQYLQEYFAVLT